MKPANAARDLAKRKPEPVPVPGVEAGDRVFFRHQDEPHTGKVICHGKHGCTIDHDGVQRRVRWEDVIGHHQRAERRYQVLERGESGAIVSDQAGRRRFVAGEVPEPDARPTKPAKDDYAKVQKLVEDATVPMKKAFTAPPGRLLFWKR